MTRKNLCALLVDLTAPIGPGASSGSRSKIQDRIEKAPLAYFEVIEEWAREVDVESTLGLLFGIALEPPDASFMDDYYGRFKALWNAALADLAYQVGLRKPSFLRKAIREYRAYPAMRLFLADLERGRESMGAERRPRAAIRSLTRGSARARQCAP
jgi:hypothetical protein